MHPKHIVIAGGLGFLGKCLTDYFIKDGARVTILTRGNAKRDGLVTHVTWDGKSAGTWTSVLDDCNVLINLNGKSVDCRYNEANKRLIYSTRLDATSALGQALEKCKVPPAVWINASSATIYRHALDRDMDETGGDIGTGFSVDVCQEWEEAFNCFKLSGTRKVILRTAIVLGHKGGALQPLKALTRIGMGGTQGPGNQYFSWLHEDDFTSIVGFVIANTNTEGVVNVAAPSPVTNRDLMKILRSEMRVPFGLPLPRWLLELGALMIGTETELILKSRRVVPGKLLEAGYKFRFTRIQEALTDLCSR